MGGGEGSKGTLKEEVEQAGSLEPDPRYIRCCSSVCRPGHALRDALLGLLVLLGLSVVVTVIFVVCFYVIPDEKQLIDDGILPGPAESSFQGPDGVNGINEIPLKDNEKYTLPPHNFEGDDLSHSQDFSTFATSSDGLPDSTNSTRQLHKEENVNLSSADANRFGTINEFDGQRADVIENFEGREGSEGGHLPGEGGSFSSEGGHLPREGGHFAGEEIHHLEHADDRLAARSQDRNGPQHNLGHRGERPFDFGDEQRHSGIDGQAKPVARGGGDGDHDDDGGSVLFPSGNVQGEGCRAVQLPMCTATVPWTLAGTPTWMNHSSDGELSTALPYIRSVLLDSGCSELAPLYACSILEPACRDLTVLPPCRSFCAEVSQSCQPPELSSDVPDLFDCGRFPDSQDPNVCILAQRGVTSMRPKLSSHLPLGSFADDSVRLFTDRSNVGSFTGISSSSQGDDDFIPTVFTTTLNGLTTSFELAESETTQAVVIDPSTSATMSLADRLKLAMSSSTASTSRPNTPKALTERTQRHSNTPKVLVTSTPKVSSATNLAGMSLADKLSSVSSVTTERIFRFKPSSNRNTRFSQETSTTTIESVASVDTSHSDVAHIGESTGVLSLAELLALSNKAKPTRATDNRTQPRRVSTSLNGNRFTDQPSAGSSSTTQKIDSTSSGIRFRGSSRPAVQSLTSQEDGDRRIPVRTVDEVPKVRFNFPMRNPAREPVTFRTTSELPETITQDTPTTRKIERPLNKFVPSTSTSKSTPTSTSTSESTPTSTSTSEITSTSTSTSEGTPTLTSTSKSTTAFTTTSETTPALILTTATTSTSTTTESTTAGNGNRFLTCPELQCLDGKCITINQLNDGVIDCSDGSDEQDFGGLVT